MKNTALNEIKSLMRRMEETSNGYTGLLTEVTCKWRYVTGVNDFYEIISSIKEGNFMTFAYVDDAKIEVPTERVRDPYTGKVKEVPDFNKLDINEPTEIVNILKVAIYNFPWQTLQKINKQYGEFAKTRNDLYAKYNLTLNDPKYKTETIPYGNSGIRHYAGNNDAIKTHTYTDINMHNIEPISVAYYVVLNGAIRKLTQREENSLKFLPPSEESAIRRLEAAGATPEEIAPLLNMDFRRFEHSKILFVSATPDSGIPTLFINNKLSEELVGSDKITPAALLKIAKDRYKKFFKGATADAELKFLRGA